MKRIGLDGIERDTEDIRLDVEKAFELGYRGKYAFTPETVLALLDIIEDFEKTLDNARSKYGNAKVRCATCLNEEPLGANFCSNCGSEL